MAVSALADLVIGASTQDSSLVVAIVLARLLVPLLIPRLPLVIVVVLVLDAADQTLLATFTEVDTTETGSYQSVDKALDIYYLAIGYLSAMRNWTSDAAFRIAQFLFYYRLVGVMAFEFSDSRRMLSCSRTRSSTSSSSTTRAPALEPSRFSARFWLLIAAGIWIFVKLPQEYWIHIAKLDFTDVVRDYPAFAVAVVVALLVLTRCSSRRVPAAAGSRLGPRLGSEPLPSSLPRRTHASPAGWSAAAS